MSKDEPTDLTDLQREILQLLAGGGIITVDRTNMARLAGRPIQPQTRYFLTSQRLVMALDKSRSIHAKGNGFVISDEGRRAIEQSRVSPKKCDGCSRRARKLIQIESGHCLCATCLEELRPPQATERQIAYARSLGIQFPPDISKADMSCLLEYHLSDDEPASDKLREIADDFNIEVSTYSGKRAIYNIITQTLKQPGRDLELAAWFAFRVSRDLQRHDAEYPTASRPSSSLCQQVATTLAQDAKAMESIRRYESRQLMWFGEWTAPDGFIHEGGSKRTIAYKRTLELFRQTPS